MPSASQEQHLCHHSLVIFLFLSTSSLSLALIMLVMLYAILKKSPCPEANSPNSKMFIGGLNWETTDR